MTVHDIGYPIACRYNVVFVSRSKRLNITFFPLTLAPPMYTSKHKTIIVGFVNDNDWVHVKLKPDSPLSLVTVGDITILKMQKHGNQHMQDKLGTEKMKLGSHHKLLYNLVRKTTFMKNMYLLYVMNF